MKNVFTFLILCLTMLGFAQAQIPPQAFNYSGVARNAQGQPISNSTIGLQISILKTSATGQEVYKENHFVNTDDFGLFNLIIGLGAIQTGSMAAINWGSDNFYLKIGMDAGGGTNFLTMGITQLLSVPYALHSKTAESLTGGGTGFSGNYDDLTNKPDFSSINTDNQQLSVSATGDTLRLQNGGYVIIPGLSAANIPQLATLSTTAVSSITATSAVSGGNISSDGGASITARGVVWSTSQNPTLANNMGIETNGTGLGSFISNLSSLSSFTTYYVKAYATNNAGTAYGNEVTFTTAPSGGGNAWLNPNLSYGSVTDQDGNSYATIIIGTQEWMAENLRTTQYRNGDLLVSVTNDGDWYGLASGAWAHFDYDSSNENPFGKLYNWAAVVDSRNVCPTGWHVPTDVEWSTLINYLDPNAAGGNNWPNSAGGKMKSTGNMYWINQNTNATNESGFSGMPGGQLTNGGSGDIGSDGYWWSSTQANSQNAWVRSLKNNSGSVSRYNESKAYGFSVRCVRD
jgi:uncharacterized protein (TIGR02145 family)